VFKPAAGSQPAAAAGLVGADGPRQTVGLLDRLAQAVPVGRGFSAALVLEPSAARRVSSMATVTKKDLIDRIASATSCKRADVKKIVQRFLDDVIEELGKGNRLEFRDFGVLETKERAPRMAQNPKTLQRVSVPAKRTVKFKVGRLLKERLDGAGEAPEVVITPDAAAALDKGGRRRAAN
jgi:integration host factor subunit beta